LTGEENGRRCGEGIKSEERKESGRDEVVENRVARSKAMGWETKQAKSVKMLSCMHTQSHLTISVLCGGTQPLS